MLQGRDKRSEICSRSLCCEPPTLRKAVERSVPWALPPVHIITQHKVRRGCRVSLLANAVQLFACSMFIEAADWSALLFQWKTETDFVPISRLKPL